MYAALVENYRKRVPHTLLLLIGMSLVFAWMSLVMRETRSSSWNPFGHTQLIFDLGSLVVFLFFCFRQKPQKLLIEIRSLRWLSGLLVTLGSVIVATTSLIQHLPTELALAGLAISGVGYALFDLFWLEYLAGLPPTSVAFCYGGSWVGRALILLLIDGFQNFYRQSWLIALPLLSFFLLNRVGESFREHGLSPILSSGSISFPWKPLVLIALYAFAYGCGTWLVFYSDNLALNLGILIPAFAVCMAVLAPKKWFNFATMYRFILPTATAGFVVLLVVGVVGEGIATFFVRASYTSIFIYATIVLCNISRRYRISAAWLFGLFNVTQISFLGFGTALFSCVPSMAVVLVCVVCILVVTFIIISEPTLDSDWNITLSATDRELGEYARKEAAVNALTRQAYLTEREREILLLLSQGQTVRAIGNRLSIAPGTVKAHIQHIYKKAGVHTKEELMALLEE